MSKSFETAIITGASSGVGRALAVQLASQGVRVGVLARRTELLEELVQEVRTQGGIIRAEAVNITEREAVLAGVRRIVAEHGPCELMIANAGLGTPTGAKPMNVPGVEAMMKVNFLGVVYAFEAVLESMLAQGRGHLVAISSLAAYKGLPQAAGYCASKAAVNRYCESLRIELGNQGVAVTAVCPGFIKTAMTAENDHPMPLLMETDEAARRILRALRRKPKVYNFPWLMYRLMMITRWMPDFIMRNQASRPASDPALPKQV